MHISYGMQGISYMLQAACEFRELKKLLSHLFTYKVVLIRLQLYFQNIINQLLAMIPNNWLFFCLLTNFL